MSEEFENNNAVPKTVAIEAELYREKYRNRYRKLLRSTIYALIIVAAISVLVATIFLPVFQIYGNSMSPTLTEGDIVFSLKHKTFEHGDIVAFYYNNQILVKRVIGVGGETVDVKDNGDVYVNGYLLDEPYIKEKDAGDGDIEYPFLVPENTYFLIGDNRATSVDSRHSSIGCVDYDEIVGEVIFAVWPLSHFGSIK